MQSSGGPREFSGTQRFAIQRRVGAGAMGVVYQAFDHERRTRVALKTLRDMEPKSIYRLKQEFRSLADVLHPNLVTLHELISAGDEWFFTMEFVEGVHFLAFVRPGYDLSSAAAETLRGEIRPAEASLPASIGRLDEVRLRHALKQLARGVAALHDAGKLHRDIKPTNVLVTPAERLVLLDFGLVTEVRPGERLKDSLDQVVGTAGYMAPEQAASQPITPASDWYAVGVMLYEALTGRLPFLGKTLEILIQKQEGIPPSPRSLRPEVPADLDILCMQLLQRRPENRPSALDVLRQLGGIPSAAGMPQISSTSATMRVPLIGRVGHLHSLDEAFRLTQKGRPVTVFVNGSSGMGKSSLVRSFIDSIRGEAVVLAGRCYERESVPYKALDSLVDALTRHLVHIPAFEVSALLPRDVGPLVKVFPVLKRVEAVANAPRRGGEIADAQELRRRAFASLREMLARIADRAPLVLYIDDLQWGDVDSGALLGELMRPPDAPPLLLICCYRSDDVSTSPLLKQLVPAQPNDHQRIVSLGALDGAEAQALARQLLGEDEPGSLELAQAIAREAGGSPFFVSELVRYVQAGAGVMPNEVTLDKLLRARISRLPDEARRLLETVAVAARPLPQELAARAAELPGDGGVALSLLRSNNLVRTLGTRGQDSVETYHDRIRETVVSQLAPELLRARNARLAAVLEDSDADPETLATHFQAAGNVERAGHFAAAAAARASETLAFERAARLYRSALELRAPDAARDLQLRILLGDALVNAGRGAEAAGVFLETARGIAPGADAASAQQGLELRRRAAEQLLRSGHIDQGTQVLREVLQAVGMDLPPVTTRSLLRVLFRRAALRLRGLGYHARDAKEIPPEQLWRIDLCWSVTTGFALVDGMRTFDFLTRHLTLALDAGEPSRIARSFALEGVLSIATGKSRSRAARLLEESRTIAERTGHAPTIGFTVMAAGIAAQTVGDWQGTREFCARAESIFRERCTGAAWELATVRFFTSLGLFYLGELAELARHVRRLLVEVENHSDIYARTHVGITWANLPWLMADDVVGARSELAHALDRWSLDGYQSPHLSALVAQVNIDLYGGNDGAAHPRVIGEWPGVEKSQLLRVRSTRIECYAMRGRAALATGVATRDDALVQLGLDDARRIDREKMPWAEGLAALLRAGAAAARGDDARALALIEAAVLACERAKMGFHAAAARRRMGELQGGDAGRAQIAEVDSFLEKEGVVKPDRLCAILTPGFKQL